MNQKIVLLVITAAMFLYVGCSDDDDKGKKNNEEIFAALPSPYLICAGRNPGGVGFDFDYNSERGGANNIDSLSVSDFEYDLIIKTIKGEKSDGSLCGMPYIELADGVKAINYSDIDTLCTGWNAWSELSIVDIGDLDYESDQSFDLSSLTPGSTGKPLASDIKAEFRNLVIGEVWRETAYNDVEGDELVWLVEISDDRLVKLIVTDFPADPAPTATGYIALDWEFLD